MKQTTLWKPPEKKKEAWDVHSWELLHDDEFLANVNEYSIRFHVADKAGPHYDFCFGNVNTPVCIDFYIPGKLVGKQLKGKSPPLPVPGERAKLMGLEPAHKVEVMTSPVGIKVPIAKGKGAGIWWTIKQGKASIKREDKYFIVWLDDVGFKLIPLKGETKKMLIARHKSNKTKRMNAAALTVETIYQMIKKTTPKKITKNTGEKKLKYRLPTYAIDGWFNFYNTKHADIQQKRDALSKLGISLKGPDKPQPGLPDKYLDKEWRLEVWETDPEYKKEIEAVSGKPYVEEPRPAKPAKSKGETTKKVSIADFDDAQTGGESVVFTARDRQNKFSIEALGGNINQVFNLLDGMTVARWKEYSQEVRGMIDMEYHLFHLSGRTIIADVGMLMIASKILELKKYVVQINDERKNIAHNPVDVEKLGKFELREYQRQAIASALKHKNGILRLATGAGKTEIAVGLVGNLGEDAVFVAPTKELAIQTKKRFELRGITNVGILYGDEKTVVQTPGLDVNIVVVNTANLLLNEETDKRLTDPDTLAERKEVRKLFKAFLAQSNVIIFDEAHHVKATTYQQFAEYAPATYRFGLSATPYAEKMGETSEVEQAAKVREKLGDIIYDLPASALIDYKGKRYLSRPFVKVVQLKLPDEITQDVNNRWIEYRAGARNYQTVIRRAVIDNQFRNEVIANICAVCKEYKMPVAVITERIRQGVNIKKFLDKLGVVSEIVASQEDKTEEKKQSKEEKELGFEEELETKIKIMISGADRKFVFEGIENGKIDVLIGTSALIGEGLDLPALMVGIIAQGNKSYIKTFQRAGRILRIHGQEKQVFRQYHSIIIDFLDCVDEKFFGTGIAASDIQGTNTNAVEYLGEHAMKRIGLYQEEEKFVVSFAKNTEDIFNIDVQEGNIVKKMNPWRIK
jgi:superfamily II DNA or RNA helicase